MRDPNYSSTATPQRGIQTAFSAGLSYFPDYTVVPMPMGDSMAVNSALALGTGGADLGADVGLLQAAFARFTGGAAVDAQRKAKATYVLQRALGGNVAAVQFIIAAPSCVSGNEAPYWQAALQAVQASSNGNALIAAAQAAGPTCLSGAGDTATNYPALVAFLNAWDAKNAPLTNAARVVQQMVTGVTPGYSPTTTLVNGRVVTTPAPSTSVLPLVLIGGGLVAAFFMFKKKR